MMNHFAVGDFIIMAPFVLDYDDMMVGWWDREYLCIEECDGEGQSVRLDD